MTRLILLNFAGLLIIIILYVEKEVGITNSVDLYNGLSSSWLLELLLFQFPCVLSYNISFALVLCSSCDGNPNGKYYVM